MVVVGEAVWVCVPVCVLVCVGLDVLVFVIVGLAVKLLPPLDPPVPPSAMTVMAGFAGLLLVPVLVPVNVPVTVPVWVWLPLLAVPLPPAAVLLLLWSLDWLLVLLPPVALVSPVVCDTVRSIGVLDPPPLPGPSLTI